jgi:hypothetical protein
MYVAEASCSATETIPTSGERTPRQKIVPAIKLPAMTWPFLPTKRRTNLARFTRRVLASAFLMRRSVLVWRSFDEDFVVVVVVKGSAAEAGGGGGRGVPFPFVVARLVAGCCSAGPPAAAAAPCATVALLPPAALDQLLSSASMLSVPSMLGDDGERDEAFCFAF